MLLFLSGIGLGLLFSCCCLSLLFGLGRAVLVCCLGCWFLFVVLFLFVAVVCAVAC